MEVTWFNLKPRTAASRIYQSFVIRIGHVQSQGRCTISQSIQQMDHNICIYTYTNSYHGEPHFMQLPPAFPMSPLTLCFPMRGVLIIGNCFSITTNVQTTANEGNYEEPYAHFITYLYWVFPLCTITDRQASQTKEGSNMHRSWP